MWSASWKTSRSMAPANVRYPHVSMTPPQNLVRVEKYGEKQYCLFEFFPWLYLMLYVSARDRVCLHMVLVIAIALANLNSHAGTAAHEILRATILEWVYLTFSRDLADRDWSCDSVSLKYGWVIVICCFATGIAWDLIWCLPIRQICPRFHPASGSLAFPEKLSDNYRPNCCWTERKRSSVNGSCISGRCWPLTSDWANHSNIWPDLPWQNGKKKVDED